jgi:coenzyme F420-0:L-glutamate ligase/coenzyme F420-1:gamma-L-glutamate ligase
MGAAWERDLRADGVSTETIAHRRARSDDLLGDAPLLAVPALTLDRADAYPDRRRRIAERDMFVLATGAAVQNLMLALHAQGLASAWISSTLFCGPETADALGLGAGWLPMGAVAIGPPPADGLPERPPLDPGPGLRWR